MIDFMKDMFTMQSVAVYVLYNRHKRQKVLLDP